MIYLHIFLCLAFKSVKLMIQDNCLVWNDFKNKTFLIAYVKWRKAVISKFYFGNDIVERNIPLKLF